MFFSLIIPVYNRPDEIRVVLEGLSRQTYRDFEVIVVEDGSIRKSDEVVDDFRDNLDVHYHYINNAGQGMARNYGFSKSEGEYIIILDSDIIIPEHYLQAVYEYLNHDLLDCFGGPDKAHPDFTPVQKAADFAMTSYLTTGGTRGRAKTVTSYYPRSFNMGMKREVYESTGGFKIPDCGEDLEFSIRIERSGYRIGLIEDAYIFHKRKGTLKSFYDQMVWFGKSRINVQRFFPESFKPIHLLPAFFYLYLLLMLLMLAVAPDLGLLMLIALGVYFLLVFVEAAFRYRSLKVAILSLATSASVFFGYGWGLIRYHFQQKEPYIKGKTA